MPHFIFYVYLCVCVLGGGGRSGGGGGGVEGGDTIYDTSLRVGSTKYVSRKGDSLIQNNCPSS